MDRKLEIKRLCIYLLLSFGLAWILFFAFSITGHKWDAKNPELESLVGLGMLAPLLAHVITRWITKEGFAMTGKDSMMMGISFKDKKWRFYLFAIFIPFLYIEIENIIFALLSPSVFQWDNYKQYDFGIYFVFFYPIICIISAVISSFAALGEEGGWRGYMMPKLIKLFGLKKALILGGIIWGLWHAPLTCCGHNFGTDYPGFPYVGIILMCISCTTMGVMLTYITYKTQSVWPAAFMHSVNNAAPTILGFFIDDEKVTGIMSQMVVQWGIRMIPEIVIAIICFVLLCKEEIKQGE